MAKDAKKVPMKTTPLEMLHDYINETMLAYPNPDKRSNEGRLLHEIWLWQEVAAFASDALKAAWRAAQAGDDALIPPDDQLRGTVGESIVADSDRYSCVVKVDAPRENFDRDAFVAIVARKHAIPASKLMGYVEIAKKESTAPLSKRIVCAEVKKR